MFSTKARKNIEALLKAYMTEIDLPNWFRGLSLFQIDAANSLMNNLRDDSAQGTCHRVRHTLRKLGIQPMVDCAKIKLAMRLSRGNDMAFLWFLMELYYRHTCDDCKHNKELGYTSNEQVIMTVIAHLDTIATLRELDRVLPPQPPQPTKKKKIRKKEPKQKFDLPYFERPRMPSPYGKSLLGIQLNNGPNLSVYDNYLNPNYIIPNMTSRWFGNYTLKEGERVAKGVIDNQINSIFEDGNNAEYKMESTQKPLLKFKASAEVLKQNLAYELMVIKEQAEKYFNTDDDLNNKSYKRIMKSLNKEILKAQEHFNQMANVNMIFSNTNRPSNVSSYDLPGNKYYTGDDIVKPHDEKNEFFIEAPICEKVYKFDYDKMFDEREKNPIQEAIANALQTCKDLEMLTDHDEEVRECCKDIWVEEVKRYNRDTEERKKLIEEEEKAKTEKANLGFDLPYYNPRDKKLMDAMICKALKEIKKDKRFVLATMPDAYKYPVLREFFKKRYGMIYTLEEKKKAFNISKKIFYWLQKNQIQKKIPRLADLSEREIVSYKCKDYILRKTKYLQDRYRHNIAMAVQDAVRTCWGAIRSDHCSKGTPRDVFYSYLPAREKDVQLFRPWKDTEYIPAKEQWDKRQAMKELALRY